MKLIAIEGGIAAGKSTLLPALAAHLTSLSGETWMTIKEPVDEDPKFHELLKQFIENPTDANKRAEFQMYMTRQRHQLLQNLPDGNYLIERSLYSDLVFTQCNMLSTEAPSGAYQAAFFDIKKHMNTYPTIDLVVYLDRNPEACLNAMKARDRSGESAYTLDYFSDLHNYHKTILPQATRMYGAKFIEVHLGNMFPDARIVAPAVLTELQD